MSEGHKNCQVMMLWVLRMVRGRANLELSQDWKV